MAVLFAFATFVSTAAGGLFALRHRDHLHLIPGFTAGVILGVVAFDSLPEMFDLAQSNGAGVNPPMLALLGGLAALRRGQSAGPGDLLQRSSGLDRRRPAHPSRITARLIGTEGVGE